MLTGKGLRLALCLAVCLSTVSRNQAQFTEHLPTLPIWPGDIAMVEGEQRAFVTEGETAIVVVLDREAGREAVFVPLKNRVAPRLTFTVEKYSAREYIYRYTVANGSEAVEEVHLWSLAAPLDAAIRTSHHAPPDRWWGSGQGRAAIADLLTRGVDKGQYVLWMASTEDGQRWASLSPGRSLGGFEAVSDFKPGFTIAYFSHIEFPPSWGEDWPIEVYRQVDPYWSSLMKRRAPRIALGPMFGPDEKLEAVAENFRLGLAYLAKSGEIDDSGGFLAVVAPALEEISATGKASRRPAQLAPANEIEREIARALDYSLGWTSSAP